jgi:hypothetical protein
MGRRPRGRGNETQRVAAGACGSRSWPQAPRLGAVALRWPSGLRLKSGPQGQLNETCYSLPGTNPACCPERQRPSRRRFRRVAAARGRYCRAGTGRTMATRLRGPPERSWARFGRCGSSTAIAPRGIERTATDPPLMRSTMLNRRPPPTTAPGRRRGPMYRCTGSSHSAQRRGLEVPGRRCVVRRPSSARYRGDLRYEHADLLVEAVGTCPVRRAGNRSPPARRPARLPSSPSAKILARRDDAHRVRGQGFLGRGRRRRPGRPHSSRAAAACRDRRGPQQRRPRTCCTRGPRPPRPR